MSMMAEITVLHWLLVASLVHMLAGLVLAMSLVIFLSTVVFEFSSTSVVQVPSGFLFSFDQILSNNNCHFFFKHAESAPPRYWYGRSFLLAVFSYLGSILSSLLCFTTYQEKIRVSQEWIRMIPGLER